MFIQTGFQVSDFFSTAKIIQIDEKQELNAHIFCPFKKNE
jgi:hypothetical protein